MIKYRLSDGVTYRETEDETGGILTICYPHRVIRLSASGSQAVKQLCGLTANAAVVNEKVAEFARDMENQGILKRHFPVIAEQTLPGVTIVIPTYDRPRMLPSCLTSLLALDYPKEKLEIIVVDDASPVPVDLGPLSNNIKLIRLRHNSGPGAARNQAVKQAKGEIIAFLDDDCVADKGWLKNLVPCFQYEDIAAVGGRVESADLTRPLDRYEQVQSPLLMGANQRKVRKGSALSYLATCNLLVRKKAFMEVGGFNSAMRVGEDVDLCWRILEMGQNIYYLPDGVVFHYHRSRLLPFLERRFNYGQSEAKLNTRYPKEIRRLIFFPGNSLIFTAAIMAALTMGALAGLFLGVSLSLVNIIWESVLKWHGIRSKECKAGLWQVFKGMLRSQGVAIYLYTQHLSRYYSIPATLLSLLTFPVLAPVILALHLLPGLVDFKMKKPSLGIGYFVFYHFWEDIFYQAGVFSGCFVQKNWRPLAMDFIRADGNLFQTLAAKN